MTRAEPEGSGPVRRPEAEGAEAEARALVQAEQGARADSLTQARAAREPHRPRHRLARAGAEEEAGAETSDLTARAARACPASSSLHGFN